MINSRFNSKYRLEFKLIPGESKPVDHNKIQDFLKTFPKIDKL